MKLTGEHRRGAGLLSSVNDERAEVKVDMVSGLVWLRVCEGR